MASPATEPVPLRGLALGAVLPALLYVAGVSPSGYWLDGGEFVAAATWLGIAHPPGQPLHALTAHLLTWLPLGPLAWRVGLASAVAAAAGCWLLAVAVWRTLSFAALGPRARLALSVLSAWAVGGSAGWWLQASRPEVYALQAALGLAVVERLLAFEQAWPARLRGGALREAALLFGLSLANHHFLGLLLLPAAAPSLARFLGVRGLRAGWPLALLSAAGLGVYAYLPLRAGAPLALGQPDELARFWWVVSAQAFQGNVGDGVPQPLAERFVDVLVLMAHDFSLLGVLALPAGLYLGLRHRGARRLAAPWAAWVLVGLAARAWLGFVRSNPDALGYLQGPWAAVLLLPVVGVLAVAELLPSAARRRLPWVLGALLLAAALLPLPARAARASLARFWEVDPVDEGLRRRLPARTVALLYAPQTVFRHWALRAEELSRPDVVEVPVPFVAYPGMGERVVAREPLLRPLVADLLLRGAPRLPVLQTLAAMRPLRVELDVRVPRALDESLLAEGLYAEALADEAAEADRREAAMRHRRRMARLWRLLGPRPWRPETEAVLLWRHYVDALHFAATGQLEAARWSVAQGLRLQPEAEELRRLAEALERAEGPLDVEPFTVGPR